MFAYLAINLTAIWTVKYLQNTLVIREYLNHHLLPVNYYVHHLFMYYFRRHNIDSFLGLQRLGVLYSRGSIISMVTILFNVYKTFIQRL